MFAGRLNAISNSSRDSHQDPIWKTIFVGLQFNNAVLELILERYLLALTNVKMGFILQLIPRLKLV